ncbi:glycosyltransferase family 2 protein [Bizionia arctica]|uniref:Glycosyl transferase n=1 Tax=Bizionia arctica TaxID=1495645 RepID=A0A917GS03_9FLAO|nr:glycosyltransferase family 2 protein [Bizionia arctica]GGG54703.1 glycosyl transferase [Bizionia arctica]
MVPYFSIVISVFNKEDFIYNTINSVINQTYSDFELIIVNDGSSDSSEDIIKSFSDSRIRYIHQENQGAGSTRNNGIKLAKSNLIALLDGDDVWLPNYLESIFNAIKAFPNEHIYTTAIAHNYPKKIVPVTYNFSIDGGVSIKNYLKESLKHTILTSSSIVFKKSVLETTGLFDTSIKSGQDTDLWIRIGMHYPIVFVNQVLVHYTYSDSSLSNSTFNLKAKPKFDKYYLEEEKNKDLKKFIDKNRFSLAILSRLTGDKKSFEFYRSHLNVTNLKLSQRLLIDCPSWLLKLLLKVKTLKGKKVYYRPLNETKSS